MRCRPGNGPPGSRAQAVEPWGSLQVPIIAQDVYYATEVKVILRYPIERRRSLQELAAEPPPC